MLGGAGEDGPSSNTSYQRPRTRQRVQKPPSDLAVPDINDDAAERKRVLNVLAQRRYRERKRLGRNAAPGTNGSVKNTPDSSEKPCSMRQAPGDKIRESASSAGAGQLSGHKATELPLEQQAPAGLDVDLGFDADGSFDTISSSTNILSAHEDNLPSFLLDAVGLVPQNLGHNPTSATLNGPAATINPLALINTPSPSNSSQSISADSYLLPMSELALIRAYLRIADRFGCGNSIWDLAAVSSFCSSGMMSSPASPKSPSSGLDLDLDLDVDFDPTGVAGMPTQLSSNPPAPGSLPPAWEPTASQMLVKHHPVLDFLPWAAARDRIISIFSLPDAVRPEVARGPLALVHFVYDLEDTAEGMRIWGGDPYDPGAWEVGQVLFERWWFVFDRDIVEQSNRWRQRRGATELRLGSSVRRDIVEESGN